MITLTEEKEDLISDSLGEFFHKVESDRIIVFDTETNGVSKENSVLSVSAILLKVDHEQKTVYEMDRLNRYYMSIEPETPQAIAVNGLTYDTIQKLREGHNYASHFKDDPEFYNFCKGCSAFIGHNLSFDLQFVPDLDVKVVFDTMFSNIKVVQASWNSYRNEWKWPKLMETAKYYEIPILENRLHESMYDVELTLSIFKKMMELGSFRMKTLPNSFIL